MTSEAFEPATLAEACQHAARLLCDIDARPRSLHVQAGNAALDIEWTQPQRIPLDPTPAAAPDGPGGEIRGPVIAAQAVGVFYRCPEPGGEPFVREGDVVTTGQQVALIEAMKLMLPVQAERPGRIVEALKGDGEPVEYGETLFVLSETGEP